MSFFSDHMKWLVKIDNPLTTSDGVNINIYEFKHEADEKILSAWAKYFRNHYCADAEIDILRNGSGLSRTDYLISQKFPDKKNGFGPSIRAGDFGEILVSDYLEYLLGYWVPRTRFDRKNIRNESPKGSDILGFKFIDDKESSQDILTIFEIKTHLSYNRNNRLQDAINDSSKDNIKKAESLNAVKQRLIDKGNLEEATKVGRFQNPTDKPYKEISGAAVLFCNVFYEESLITATNTKQHPNRKNLSLVVIRGESFMTLIHDLYERAANEA
jgi:hypothetical protein